MVFDCDNLIQTLIIFLITFTHYQKGGELQILNYLAIKVITNKTTKVMLTEITK